jgi:hypothetical protein
MKYLFVVGFCIFAPSCNNCDTELSLTSLRSTCPISQGFTIKRINVRSFDDVGLPATYIDEQSVVLALNGAGVDEILFNEPSEDYYWIDFVHGAKYDTVPFSLTQSGWYLIRGLVYLGNPDHAAFIWVHDTSTFKVYGFSESKTW